MSCYCENENAILVDIQGVKYCETTTTVSPSCKPKSCPPGYTLSEDETECILAYNTGNLCPDGYLYVYVAQNPEDSYCEASNDIPAECNCLADVIASPQTICSGGNTSVALTSTLPSGVVYSWVVLQTGVNGGTSGNSIASGNTISQPLVATGATPGTAIYTITPYEQGLSGCSGTPIQVTVTVNPKPNILVIPTSPQTVANNSTLNIAISSGLPGTTFAWTVTAPTTITGAVAGSGTSITDTLVASASGAVTYHIVATAPNGCTNTLEYTVNVTLIPNCPNRRVAFQICNSNSIKDDNFAIYLNGTHIGDVDLNHDALVGSVFIADLDPTHVITSADFTCPISNMVIYRFNPNLLQATNTILMQNIQANGAGNAGVFEVRNYLLTGTSLSSPCVIANRSYVPPNGGNATFTFDYTSCCAGD